MVRRLSTVLVVTAAMVGVSCGGVLLATLGAAPPASAQGCAPQLSVSRTTGLAPAGETVTVSGSCYDVNKGVYVAFCVVPPPGTVPSPCGGGVDMSGAGGLSHWISSNPPPQGVGLTAPYGPGGSFTVSMRPSSQLNATVDCRRVSCAIVTRNDHTRSSDRSQDVIVPVTFSADPAPSPAAPAVPALPALPALPPLPGDPSLAAPPAEAEATTTVPVEEATTTTAPTAASTSTTAVVTPAEDELAASAASSEGGGSAAPVAVVLGAVALVVAVAGGGWWALRGRPHAGDGSSS